MFLIPLFLTALVIVSSMIVAWRSSRDPLHPAMLFAVPLGGLYVAQPLLLFTMDQAELELFLSPLNLIVVATMNLFGVAALCHGVLGPKGQSKVLNRVGFASNHRGLRTIGICLGATAIISYIYCIQQVGGLYQAYGQAYGGGWSNLGYVREAFWLSVPAITLIAISKKRLTMFDYFLTALCAFPLLFHGIVGARRGPTAAGFLTLWLSRTLASGKRPPLIRFLTGMVALGLFLLALVANRSSLMLGGDLEFDRGVDSYATRVGCSNEFVYGGAVMLTSWKQGVHYDGRRYFTVMFIRPIPVQMFPTKYAFAAKNLGIPNLSEQGSNLGTGNLDFVGSVGWEPANGAAPGLIADLWLEFSIGYVIVLWLIGRFYWFGWHRAMMGNRFWGIAYIVMSALSIYLIMQTLEAMLFRFLLAAGFVCLTWFIVEGRWPRFEFRLRRRNTRASNLSKLH